MKNVPCSDCSEQQEAELLQAFPESLSIQEEEWAASFFYKHLFYWPQSGGKLRDCWCTACRESFTADKKMNGSLMSAKHGERAICPYCGSVVRLVAAGRMKNYTSLSHTLKFARLSAHNGFLLVECGDMTRTYYEGDYGVPEAGYDFTPYVRYVFAPGFRIKWVRQMYEWFGCYRSRSGKWARKKTVSEPYQGYMYAPAPEYFPIGLEAIAESDMRYCQYVPWIEEAYGSRIDGLAGMTIDDIDEAAATLCPKLIRYLSEYTRRPQMEFLVKLGFHSFVTDLVVKGNANGNLVNWRAKSPPEFFRLSKQDFREFRECGLDLLSLREYRQLRARNLVPGLKQYMGYSKSKKQYLHSVVECAVLVGIKLEKALRYAEEFGPKELTAAETAQEWLDYLKLAKALKYDLKREDVTMPKDLHERHDQAAAANRVMVAEQQTKSMKKLTERLEQQFAFEYDGLSILAPVSVEEIIAEGKALKHCVGGYAERHARGSVIILFLRKTKRKSRPLCTIELSVETNCAKVSIRQMHGYQNDRGRMTAAEKYKKFTEVWLDWIHAGSPRDIRGLPVIHKKDVVA